MDVPFPERYWRAKRHIHRTFGDDLAASTRLDDAHKLSFFALMQQAEHGECHDAAPFWWNTRERAKHDAWAALQSMSSAEAMVHVVQLLEQVVGGDAWIQHEIHQRRPLEKRSDALHDVNGENEKPLLGNEDALDLPFSAANFARLKDEIRALRQALAKSVVAVPFKPKGTTFEEKPVFGGIVEGATSPTLRFNEAAELDENKIDRNVDAAHRPNDARVVLSGNRTESRSADETLAESHAALQTTPPSMDSPALPRETAIPTTPPFSSAFTVLPPTTSATAAPALFPPPTTAQPIYYERSSALGWMEWFGF